MESLGPVLVIASDLHPLSAVVLLVGLAVGALLVELLAVTARRLLGLRVGTMRTLAAGAIGYVVASLVAAAISPSHHNRARVAPPAALLPVLIGISVLVAMALLIGAEAVTPSGSRARPVRALRRRLRRARRYGQIIVIAARHGLAPLIRGRGSPRGGSQETRAARARSVRVALSEGGVTFVKLGQLLSTRRDLLPADLVAELGQLQHQALPAPPEQIHALLVQELGAPPQEVFAEFDATPLAAAGHKLPRHDRRTAPRPQRARTGAGVRAGAGGGTGLPGRGQQPPGGPARRHGVSRRHPDARAGGDRRTVDQPGPGARAAGWNPTGRRQRCHR